MVTFGLSADDSEGDGGYMGDSDMYWRRWRQPSMQPVRSKMFDQIQEKERRDNLEREKKLASIKSSHKAQFAQKMNRCELNQRSSVKTLKQSTVAKTSNSQARTAVINSWRKIAEHPSSDVAVNLVDVLKAPPRKVETVNKEVLNQSGNSSFGTDSSFNTDAKGITYLKNFNGHRPSFALGPACTSTPVSKTGGMNFSFISEVDESQYVTAPSTPAMKEPLKPTTPSPLVKAPEPVIAQSTSKLKENEAPKAPLARQPLQHMPSVGFNFNQPVAKPSVGFNFNSAASKPLDGSNSNTPAAKPSVGFNFNSAAPQSSTTPLQTEKNEFVKKTVPQEPKPLEIKPVVKPPTPPSVNQEKIINVEDDDEDQKPMLEVFGDVIKKKLAEDHVKAQFDSNQNMSKLRNLLKKSISERVNVSTRRDVTKDAREETIKFFNDLMHKKPLKGFNDEPLQLKTSVEVYAAAHYMVDRYLNIVEQDEKLIGAVSSVIARLSASNPNVEIVFIAESLDRCHLLSLDSFNLESIQDNHEKTYVCNRERSLCTLFFSVFSKNILFATKRPLIILNMEKLWECVDMILNYAENVSRSAVLLRSLLENCMNDKCLNSNPDRCEEMMATIRDILPTLEESAMAENDFANVSQLRNLIDRLDQ